MKVQIIAPLVKRLLSKEGKRKQAIKFSEKEKSNTETLPLFLRITRLRRNNGVREWNIEYYKITGKAC